MPCKEYRDAPNKPPARTVKRAWVRTDERGYIESRLDGLPILYYRKPEGLMGYTVKGKPRILKPHWVTVVIEAVAR